jgi:ABC-type transporter Mla subunit MlaD
MSTKFINAPKWVVPAILVLTLGLVGSIVINIVQATKSKNLQNTINQTSKKLQKANSDLNQAISELQKANSDLNQTRSELQKANSDLKQAKLDLNQANSELKQAGIDQKAIVDSCITNKYDEDHKCTTYYTIDDCPITNPNNIYSPAATTTPAGCIKDSKGKVYWSNKPCDNKAIWLPNDSNNGYKRFCKDP